MTKHVPKHTAVCIPSSREAQLKSLLRAYGFLADHSLTSDDGRTSYIAVANMSDELLEGLAMIGAEIVHSWSHGARNTARTNSRPLALLKRSATGVSTVGFTARPEPACCTVIVVANHQEPRNASAR